MYTSNAQDIIIMYQHLTKTIIFTQNSSYYKYKIFLTSCIAKIICIQLFWNVCTTLSPAKLELCSDHVSVSSSIFLSLLSFNPKLLCKLLYWISYNFHKFSITWYHSAPPILFFLSEDFLGVSWCKIWTLLLVAQGRPSFNPQLL